MKIIDALKNIKINTLKLSGIKTLILVEVTNSNYILYSIENKYPYIIFDKKKVINKSEKCITEVFDKNKNLSEIINDFTRKLDLENYKIVLLINDFRIKPFKVPIESGIVDVWLDENLHKIIPPSQDSKEFVIETVNYHSDEEFNYVLTFVIRKSVINKISADLKNETDNLILISSNLIGFIKNESDKNNVYFNLGSDKADYIMFNEENEFLTGSFYSSYFKEETEGGKKEDYLLSVMNLEELIKDFYKENFSEINFQFSYSQHLKNKQILNDFTEKKHFNFIKPEIVDSSSENFLLQRNLHSFIYDYSNLNNFLPSNLLNKTREEFDKNIFNKITILFGGILIVFLLLLYLAEDFIYQRLSESENSKIDVDFKIEKIDNLETQNHKLEQDYLQLIELKKYRTDYSRVLEEVTDLINDDVVLSNFEIKYIDKKLIYLTIQGESDNQETITNLIEDLENVGKIKNVSLVKSKIVRNEKSRFGKKGVTFVIGANYDSDFK